MNIPVLGVPHYNRPDLLIRLIESIDHPVNKLVIIQNGPDAQMPLELKLNMLVEEVVHIRHPNAGVAGAWNEIIKLFPAPYWVISNNDILFAPGDLGRMAQAAEKESGDGISEMGDRRSEMGGENIEHGKAGGTPAPPGILYGNHGASFFAVTQYGIDRVGLFDENIYPAYLEDCDWSYRADLLGVRRMNVEGCSSIHGDERLGGSCTVNSDPVLATNCGRTHGKNFAYYEAKWGGVNEKETFKTPFNNPRHPVWAWTFNPFFRAEQQWKI